MISQSAVHSAPHRTDIYVGRGFSEYEVAAVTRVLSCANEVRRSERFSWRYVSAAAGLVTGTCGMILRSEPAVDTYDLGQALVVTGGASGTNAQWMNRLRQMVRQARPVLVLSDAATAYLRRTRRASADVTTHWRDAVHLAETGRYPTLTGRLAATSDGVTTAAGEGATEEAVLSMLAPHIAPQDIIEIGNRLLLPALRQPHASQPSSAAPPAGLTSARLGAAIDIMEQTLDAPLGMDALTARLGVSTRHLERIFNEAYGEPPARFYRRLRVKHARIMIEESHAPLGEIAVATGFGSSNALNRAVKAEYGISASKMRSSGGLKRLHGAPGKS